MGFKVAINGYGRIGQSLLRVLFDRNIHNLEVVAINELANIDTIAYLTRYDSTHGRFPGQVRVIDNDCVTVNDSVIKVVNSQAVNSLPWGQFSVDLVMDCTGAISAKSQLQDHISAGAKKVLLSQPGDADLDKTIVYGINHQSLTDSDRVVSAASCTSNAVVPLLSIINASFNIESGALTTIHSAMNDQPVIDAYHHHDLRRTRSAMQNIVPVNTELVRGIERILPELTNKLSATAIRVPTVNVSAMEVCINVSDIVTTKTVNAVLKRFAEQDTYSVIKYTEEPLASSDFLQDSHSCIVDGSQTTVSGKHLIKLLIWFDNEWAFANRMLDIAEYWLSNTNSQSTL